jgi:TRAP-type mannitol/chloroaromatic compound transport system permease small subunit
MTSWGLLPNGTWGEWEVSPDPGGLPRAPIKSMIIVAFSLMLLQSISQLIKYFAVIVGHEEVYEAIQAETEQFQA